MAQKDLEFVRVGEEQQYDTDPSNEWYTFRKMLFCRGRGRQPLGMPQTPNSSFEMVKVSITP